MRYLIYRQSPHQQHLVDYQQVIHRMCQLKYQYLNYVIGLSVECLFELAEMFDCETNDLLQTGSTQVRDQARQIDLMLQGLSENERVDLLNWVQQMIQWKK